RQEASETGSSGSSVARATVEVDSQSEVLCLCLPWSWLKSERPLLEALQKGFATSLAAQVAAGDAAARLLEYAAVLEMEDDSRTTRELSALSRRATRSSRPTSRRDTPSSAASHDEYGRWPPEALPFQH
ncbi:unnamed protein product, partial [Durusdinium trenchii]